MLFILVRKKKYLPFLCFQLPHRPIFFREHVNYEEDKNKVPMNKSYSIQNTNICNGIFHISFFKALLMNEGEPTRGERDSGRSDLDSTGPQRSGSDVESWYGYYTVLLLTLRYVHELSIRRLLFVYYTCTTEGQYKNVDRIYLCNQCISPLKL